MSARRLAGSIAVLLLLALALPDTLAAQSPWRLRGPWLGAGLGVGVGRQSCDACIAPESERGGVGRIALGYALSSRLIVAAEVNGWFRFDAGLEEHMGAAGATVYLFPHPRSGLFVAGGLDLARARTVSSNAESDDDQTSTTGLGAHAAVGYDLPIGREVSLVPQVGYYRGFGSNLRLNGFDVGERATHSAMQVTLGLHWHLGQVW